MTQTYSKLPQQHIWRAGTWYTLKPRHNAKFFTDSGTEMKLNVGDVVQYKGCQTIDGKFWRFFSFNGIRLRAGKWIDPRFDLERN